MFVSFIRYIQGYLKIRVTGYSPERFINLCKNKKIPVWGLESKYNAYEMYIKISGFRKLKPILKKTQTKVSIEERFGLPFFFHRYRKRKIFFIGSIVAVLLIYSMTFFVWNIDLEGNQTITDDVLIEYLESQNISHGMAKYKVDCEQIAKEIRKNFNEIIWVSASVEGTRLYIHVKENADTFEEELEEGTPCDIVSDKSGIIVSIVTRRGTPKVKVGDEVKEGDILVSGVVDVLNDAKEVVSQNFVSSDADIVLETTRHYEDSIEKKYEEKKYTDKKRTIYFVKVGDYSLNFGIQKNSYEKFDQETEEQQLKLGENFYLPFFVGNKKIFEYEIETLEYSDAEMENLLNERYELFCKKLESERTVILEKNLHITPNNMGMKAETILILQEEAGIHRKIVDFSQMPMVE